MNKNETVEKIIKMLSESALKFHEAAMDSMYRMPAEERRKMFARCPKGYTFKQFANLKRQYREYERRRKSGEKFGWKEGSEFQIIDDSPD